MYNYIQALEEHGIDPSMMVSQGYDGTSIMSRHCTGVQKRIKDKYPSTIYIPCYAHVLYLILCLWTVQKSSARS